MREDTDTGDDVSINNQQHEDMHSTNTHDTQPQPQQKQHQNGAFRGDEEGESLYGAVLGLLRPIFLLDPKSPSTIFHRTKDSLRQNLPHLLQASTTAGSHLLLWARQGSPLRLLLLLSVGTITLLALSGILVFTLFLAAATINGVVLSIFMSLAAAGGFLAIFFACLAAIYIGALSVAIFVISSVTIAASIAVFVVTGWVAFFWVLWLVTSKSIGAAKHLLSVPRSALSAYTSAWQAHRHHHHHDD